MEGGLKRQANSTDKKENKIFLIYKVIQSGAVAKSYLRKGFLIYEEMRKYLVIYEEAVSHKWLCNRSLLDFLIYEKISSSLFSVGRTEQVVFVQFMRPIFMGDLFFYSPLKCVVHTVEANSILAHTHSYSLIHTHH